MGKIVKVTALFAIAKLVPVVAKLAERFVGSILRRETRQEFRPASFALPYGCSRTHQSWGDDTIGTSVMHAIFPRPNLTTGPTQQLTKS
tara:strand:- start:210 stop:476 length:267 start_codon:yes stop_codon:yes gene_type:complete